jgi:predicted DNA-binding transcriptional regulator YafY
MRRADRLLQIVQFMRRHKGAVTARMIADELEVVERTVYRDIASLQSTGVPIEGAAGVGYVLADGYDLPPLMFTAAEIDAIILGTRLVAQRGDADIGKAAADVLAKISTVVPLRIREQIRQSAMLVPPFQREHKAQEHFLPDIREAIRGFSKAEISYRDEKGAETARTIWPLGLAYFERVTLICAWCELRQDYRGFRIDRVSACTIRETSFNPKNGALLRAFLIRATEQDYFERTNAPDFTRAI